MSSNLLAALGSPPAAQALADIGRLVVAGYTTGPAPLLPSAAASSLGVVLSPPFPRAWLWEESGSKICLVNGTSDPPGEVGPQMIGWLNPTAIDGGHVNAWYYMAAQLLAAALPGGVDLVIGHSMGGGIAIELARQLRLSNTSPNVGAVAIGAPRSRSVTAAAAIGTYAISIAYVTDSIPYLPGELPGGPAWRRPGRLYSMDDVGTLSAAAEGPMPIAVLAGLMARWGTAPHASTWYSSLFLTPVSPKRVVPISGPRIIDP